MIELIVGKEYEFGSQFVEVVELQGSDVLVKDRYDRHFTVMAASLKEKRTPANPDVETGNDPDHCYGIFKEDGN